MSMNEAPEGTHTGSPRSPGAGRPGRAILLGLTLGVAFGVFVYHYGLGHSGSNLGAGSVAIAVVIGLITAVGGAWTMFRKGW